MSTLDQAMDYLADRADMGTYLTFSANKSVSSKTSTTIQTFSLPTGRWLVVSYMDLSASGTGTYNHVLDGKTVRSPETNGGGSMNVRIITKASTGSVTVSGYANMACTMRSTVWAIRLAPA